jgi:hypothetical protein
MPGRGVIRVDRPQITDQHDVSLSVEVRSGVGMDEWACLMHLMCRGGHCRTAHHGQRAPITTSSPPRHIGTDIADVGSVCGATSTALTRRTDVIRRESGLFGEGEPAAHHGERT